MRLLTCGRNLERSNVHQLALNVLLVNVVVLLP